MDKPLDPRVNAYRDDLADEALRGRVDAAAFVAGRPRRVAVPAEPLRRVPDADAPYDSEVLHGEVFTVFDDDEEGWSWGQLATDGYVGYLPTDALDDDPSAPTHRVAALRTFVYPVADLRSPPRALLPFRAEVAIGGATETRGLEYCALAGEAGYVVAPHLAPLDAAPEGDFVAVAERFLHTPYLWGGRTSLGLDCSALVQLSLAATGHAAPRDTDQQEAALGAAVEGGAAAPLRRGDLVFWKGHVAIMLDGEYAIHASGFRMAVVVEALKEAVARMEKSVGRPTAVRRL
jgi:cell wall-associated NlpC family hydrolase